MTIEKSCSNCEFHVAGVCREPFKCFRQSYWHLRKELFVGTSEVKTIIEDMFHKVANEIADTLSKKNHDYGDSVFNNYKKFGDVAMYIRLSDKLGRLETLIQGNEKISSESIDDAYLDLAGYAILALVNKRRATEGGQ